MRRLALIFCLALLACGACVVHAEDAPALRGLDRWQSIIKHHSFTPPLLQAYYGDGELPYWVIFGSTVVTDNYVRLTPDELERTGHLWNTEPLDMNAFEILFSFRVVKHINTAADGFALWIVNQIPRLEGVLFGHPMKFVGIGILFDTYDNDGLRDNPMVSIIYNRDGEDVKTYSPQKDFRDQYKAACRFDYLMRDRSRSAMARLRYKHGSLQLYLSMSDDKSEKLCFSVDGVQLNLDRERYYIGFTAATGGVSETHEIVTFQLYPLEGETYDHDVHAIRTTAHIPQNTPPPPQQQQQQVPPPPPPPPPQQEYVPPPQQQQQAPPPPPQQEYVPPPQQQQQQVPPPPPPPPPQQEYVPPQQQEQQVPPPPQQEQQQQQMPVDNDAAERLRQLELEIERLRNQMGNA